MYIFIVAGAYPVVHTVVSSMESTYETGAITVDTDTGNVYVFSGIQWLLLGEKS